MEEEEERKIIYLMHFLKLSKTLRVKFKTNVERKLLKKHYFAFVVGNIFILFSS